MKKRARGRGQACRTENPQVCERKKRHEQCNSSTSFSADTTEEILRMDRQAVLEKTRKELRSVLISAPRGVPARMLLKDYKMVTGKELPYRQLGFNTLEDFIHSQSDVVRIGSGPTGEPTFYGVANAETAQISRFVASQKKTKLKKSLAPPPVVTRTPMKMAAFTKKFRYGPRTSPRGGANHRIGRAGLSASVW